MRIVANTLTLASALLLSACASWSAAPPQPGDTVEAVIARLGAPTDVYVQSGVGQVLSYPRGPYGQVTYMATFGPDHRLKTYEQVLTGEKFALIKVDRATKDDVLRTLGRPAERSRVAMHDYEVWSYRYKENGVWDAMMHVHFDHQGIVRLMQNGPDPMYDRRYWR